MGEKTPSQSKTIPIRKTPLPPPQPPARSASAAIPARSASLVGITRHPHSSCADCDIPRPLPHANRVDNPVSPRIDPLDCLLEVARCPHRPVTEGQSARAPTDLDPRQSAARGRVDANDRITELVDDPDRTSANLDMLGCEAEAVGPRDPAGPRVNPEDTGVEGVAERPDGAEPARHVLYLLSVVLTVVR